MNKRLLVLVFISLMTSILGCSGGDGDGGVMNPPSGNANVAGTWSFTANPSNPPRATSCSGDLSGSEGLFCDFLVIPFTQNGTSYSGAATSSYCGVVFSTSGTVTGDSISGNYVSTDGVFTYRISYSGTVSGNTMTAAPGTFTVDGFSGTCSCAGVYNAVR